MARSGYRISKENSKVTAEKNATEMELLDLSLNTRRNTLRISNPACIELETNRELEDTDSPVLRPAVSLRLPLEPWEIGRSHRFGKKRPRLVLVKFISYNIRYSFFEAQKMLKDHSNLRKIYINEDLTLQNNGIRGSSTKKAGSHQWCLYQRRTYLCETPSDGKAVVIRDLNHLQTVARPPTPCHAPRWCPGDTPAPVDRNEMNDDTMVSTSLLQPRPPTILSHTMNSESEPALTSTPRRSLQDPVTRVCFTIITVPVGWRWLCRRGNRQFPTLPELGYHGKRILSVIVPYLKHSFNSNWLCVTHGNIC